MLNKVMLIGNLGGDPEVRYMPNGDPVANFSIATSKKWKDKAGEKRESTEWHRISLFGKLAEVAGEYLKKGAKVYLEGEITTRKWEDKEGVTRYTTEIRCHTMTMLGSKDHGGGEEQSEQPKQQARPASKAKASAGSFDDLEDDIPF